MVCVRIITSILNILHLQKKNKKTKIIIPFNIFKNAKTSTDMYEKYNILNDKN